jgi:hypothetical protein
VLLHRTCPQLATADAGGACSLLVPPPTRYLCRPLSPWIDWNHLAWVQMVPTSRGVISARVTVWGCRYVNTRVHFRSSEVGDPSGPPPPAGVTRSSRRAADASARTSQDYSQLPPQVLARNPGPHFLKMIGRCTGYGEHGAEGGVSCVCLRLGGPQTALMVACCWRWWWRRRQVLFAGARDAAAVSKITKEEEAEDRYSGRSDDFGVEGFDMASLRGVVARD